MNKFFYDKRIIYIYIVTIIIIILGITFALNESSYAFNADTGVYGIDKTQYGETHFNSANLDLKPILDSEVTTKTDNVIKIDFKVGGSENNPSDRNIIYDIALTDLDIDCDLLSSYVKWKLVKNGEELYSGTLSNDFDTIVDGRLVLTRFQQDLKPYNEDKNVYDNYTFYLWLSDSCQSSNLSECFNSEDQSSLLGKSLSGKIEVELNTGFEKENLTHPSSGDACSNIQKALFDPMGGEVSISSKEIVSGEAYGTLPTPTRENYTFDGWHLDEDYTLEVKENSIVNTSGNIILYAKWVPLDYNITYNLSNCTTNDNPSTYNIDTPTFTLNDPTCPGYKFNGWTGSNGNTPTKNVTISKGSTGDKTYCVNIIPNDYVITFVSDGTEVEKKTLTYEGVLGTLPIPTKTGYTFSGWYTADSGGTEVTENTSVPSEDTTYYAHWTAKSYTITYNSNNLLYDLTDKGSTTTEGITYSISNGVITATSSRDDGYGNTTGRVYLEAGTTYIFNCETDGTWGYTQEVEALLLLDGGYSKYYGMSSNNNYTFTPDTTGTYHLRIDVNISGQTHTFSNISVSTTYGTKEVTYDSTYGDLLSPTRVGYSFLGWYDDTTESKYDASTTYKSHPLYYYSDYNSDLYNAFGYNESSLNSHYINYGKNEGRRTSQYISTDTVKITDDITLYAGWARSFICASAGSNTSYMGNEWFTVSNDGTTCELALQGTVGYPTGNTYDGSGGLSGYVSGYIANFTNGINTVKNEVDAGLITSIDTIHTNSNTLTSGSPYWFTDGGIYDPTPRYNYGWNTENAFCNANWLTTTVTLNCTVTGSTSYYSVLKDDGYIHSVSSSAGAITYETPPSSSGVGYGSPYYTWIRPFSDSGDLSYFKFYAYTSADGNTNTGNRSDLIIAFCGGPFHNAHYGEFVPYSSTKYKYWENENSAFHYPAYSSNYYYVMAGIGNWHTGVDKSKETLNFAAGSDCKPYYTYSGNTTNEPIMYRPHIKVKIGG